jgi:hypothetical protein
MSKQPEALRLAEHLVDMSNKYRTPSHERGVVNGAIQELRRLHAANAELVAALEGMLHLDEDVCLEVRQARAALSKHKEQQ